MNKGQGAAQSAYEKGKEGAEFLKEKGKEAAGTAQKAYPFYKRSCGL